MEVVQAQIQCLEAMGQRFVKAVRDLGLESEEEQEEIPVLLQLYLED